MSEVEVVSFMAKFYEYEEQRRRDIDQKASWGMTFCVAWVGLSSSVLSLLLSTPIIPIGGPWWFPISFFVAGLLSTLFATYTFWDLLHCGYYSEPLPESEANIRRFVRFDAESYDKLYYGYLAALLRNRVIDDKKAERYNRGYEAFSFGIGLISLSLVFLALFKYV